MSCKHTASLRGNGWPAYAINGTNFFQALATKHAPLPLDLGQLYAADITGAILAFPPTTATPSGAKTPPAFMTPPKPAGASTPEAAAASPTSSIFATVTASLSAPKSKLTATNSMTTNAPSSSS